MPFLAPSSLSSAIFSSKPVLVSVSEGSELTYFPKTAQNWLVNQLLPQNSKNAMLLCSSFHQQMGPTLHLGSELVYDFLWSNKCSKNNVIRILRLGFNRLCKFLLPFWLLGNCYHLNKPETIDIFPMEPLEGECSKEYTVRNVKHN